MYDCLILSIFFGCPGAYHRTSTGRSKVFQGPRVESVRVRAPIHIDISPRETWTGTVDPAPPFYVVMAFDPIPDGSKLRKETAAFFKLFEGKIPNGGILQCLDGVDGRNLVKETFDRNTDIVFLQQPGGDII